MSRDIQEKRSILDKVEKCSLLHSGGEACIYKVLAEGRDYVLKWYKPGCSFDGAVLDEVAKSRNSGHFLLREHGLRLEKGQETPYLLYDFVDGISSGNIQKMPVVIALYVLQRLAKTLFNLRKVNVSHGDLSPSNVVLTVAEENGGKGLLPVLIDFGIQGPGALAYAAPERFKGDAPSEKSDMFSLGLLLYRWISGGDLLMGKDFDEYAAASGSVDCSKISESLYVGNALSAMELSALEPLWSGLLKADPQERLEDLDELDEVLELALDKVSGGQVAVATSVQKFVAELEIEKAGTKVPSAEDCDLPYAISTPEGKRLPVKVFVLTALVLIFLMIILWFAIGKKGADIDATGVMLLKQSRSLEQDSPVDSSGNDSLSSEKILENLPTPASDL